MPLSFALPRGSAIVLLGWRALRGVGYEPEAVAVRLVWFRVRDFRYPPIAQIFRHVVMQGQKWDRSDFVMLLPEAGTFDSPRTPAAASGAGFGGA